MLLMSYQVLSMTLRSARFYSSTGAVRTTQTRVPDSWGNIVMALTILSTQPSKWARAKGQANPRHERLPKGPRFASESLDADTASGPVSNCPGYLVAPCWAELFEKSRRTTWPFHIHNPVRTITGRKTNRVGPA